MSLNSRGAGEASRFIGLNPSGAFRVQNNAGDIFLDLSQTSYTYTQDPAGTPVDTYNYDVNANEFTARAGSGAGDGLVSGDISYFANYDTGVVTIGPNITLSGGDTNTIVVGAVTIDGDTGAITGLSSTSLVTSDPTVIVENDITGTADASLATLSGAGVQIGADSLATLGLKYNALEPDMTTVGNNVQFAPTAVSFGGMLLERDGPDGFGMMFSTPGGDATTVGSWAINIEGTGDTSTLSFYQRRTVGGWTRQFRLFGFD